MEETQDDKYQLRHSYSIDTITKLNQIIRFLIPYSWGNLGSVDQNIYNENINNEYKNNSI